MKFTLHTPAVNGGRIEEIYKEGTDAHIDTALRKAVANLGFPQFAESK